HILRTIKKQTPVPPLLTPTTITAQNGATLTQNTKITITNCPKKAKPVAMKKSKRPHKKKH
ncbi:MAG TPA: hypothetical protein VGH60_10255, partial [Solirubrobacteraceae bacterium]